MNTQNNSRRRSSVERMENAFMALLEKEELEDITVSRLCKEAGLNRTTFYAVYEGIWDLADSIRRKLEDNLDVMYLSEIEKGYNGNDYLKLFRHIKDNQKFYATYFRLGFDEHYRIKKYDVDRAKAEFDDRFVEYHMEFFRSGITAIIKMWLAGGCNESPEDMCEVLRAEYGGRG
ncbi:MAG: TetR/AcrR family transcriptional regulator [Spirochaetes bacterium]|uniref:TetR/AcrR family transcriptional regulator n=1 Tax=Candidatus Aphodenecus pullistercoris TaxID=2840669 RepID=A0A9D9EAA3_9SPIR|nr:TetR/AcrR family transcriptional regulator [Candidatus Aphodenecus pullistercoris]